MVNHLRGLFLVAQSSCSDSAAKKNTKQWVRGAIGLWSNKTILRFQLSKDVELVCSLMLTSRDLPSQKIIL